MPVWITFRFVTADADFSNALDMPNNKTKKYSSHSYGVETKNMKFRNPEYSSLSFNSLAFRNVAGSAAVPRNASGMAVFAP